MYSNISSYFLCSRVRGLATLAMPGLLLVASGCSAPNLSAEANVAAAAQAVTANGTWTKVTSVPACTSGGCQPGNIALLTDGRVLLSGPETSNQWFTLTPQPVRNGVLDIPNEYRYGTWNSVGNSSWGRLFNPSFILQNGRYWNCGGEYSTVGGSFNTSECEVFNPATNTWVTVQSMPRLVNDTPAAILPNGGVLTLSWQDQNSYIFNPWTGAWGSAASYDSAAIQSEGGGVTLPDGSALFGLHKFSRYLPGTDTWVPTANTQPALDALVSSNTSDEIGPFLFLETGPVGAAGSGKVLVLGANSSNALYTPPTTLNGAGSWSVAAGTPADLSQPLILPRNHGDAPAAVEPGGNVFTIADTDPNGSGAEDPVFLEYQPSSDAWATIPYPTVNGVSVGAPGGLADRVRLLVLPTGQILVSGWSDGSLWLYQASGTPDSTWNPNITNVAPPVFGQIRIDGTQLNGVSTGADLGDDGKLSTNFPLVALWDGSSFYSYVRTHGFSTMGPNPGASGYFFINLAEASQAVPNGFYFLDVRTNGLGLSGSGLPSLIVPKVDVGAAILAAIAG